MRSNFSRVFHPKQWGHGRAQDRSSMDGQGHVPSARQVNPQLRGLSARSGASASNAPEATAEELSPEEVAAQKAREAEEAQKAREAAEAQKALEKMREAQQGLSSRLRREVHSANDFESVRAILGPDSRGQSGIDVEHLAERGTLRDLSDAWYGGGSPSQILKTLATRIRDIEGGRDQVFVAVRDRAANVEDYHHAEIRIVLARQLEALSPSGIERVYPEMLETARNGFDNQEKARNGWHQFSLNDYQYGHVLIGLARALPKLPAPIQREKAEELLGEIERLGRDEFRAEALEAFASSMVDMDSDALEAVFDRTLDAVTPMLSLSPAACALPHLAAAVSGLSDIDMRLDRFARVFAAANGVPAELSAAGLPRTYERGLESRIPSKVHGDELRARTLVNLASAAGTFEPDAARSQIAMVLHSLERLPDQHASIQDAFVAMRPSALPAGVFTRAFDDVLERLLASKALSPAVRSAQLHSLIDSLGHLDDETLRDKRFPKLAYLVAQTPVAERQPFIDGLRNQIAGLPADKQEASKEWVDGLMQLP